MPECVLAVDDLRAYFHTEEGVVKAVDGVSFEIGVGQTLGLVGESGSGKSVTSLSILRLLGGSARTASGLIAFLGRDLVGLPEKEMQKVRGKEVSMIFQEPMTSLNPVVSVGSQIVEAIRIHQKVSRTDARKRAAALFEEVGMANANTRLHAYPHQLSGGQKQRVMIAMALACDPQLLIADEPTTALDVTIQAQILDILRAARDRRGMSVLFITHDLGVIAEIADKVAVMRNGKIVEYGSVLDIFQSPQHPYTRGLLACRPRLETSFRRLPTLDDILARESKDRPPNENAPANAVRLLHPQAKLVACGHAWEDTAREQAHVLTDDAQPLLEVCHLEVVFPVQRGLLGKKSGEVRAVDGVSFEIYRGQTLGLVGESGCGKTTLGRALLRLMEPTAGSIAFDGKDISALSDAQMAPLRRRMQIIFQDPYGSMNPRFTIESVLAEPMRIQKIGVSKRDRRDRSAALLEEVGLESAHLRRYPHEFSGGQRQRICIARALAVEPEFLVCDESVSALDVSVQAQVLNLLKDLREKHRLTYLFISHDLSVVHFMADMLAVMNAGRIVEFGPAPLVYHQPREAYTRQLIAATPQDDLASIRRRQAERRR